MRREKWVSQRQGSHAITDTQTHTETGNIPRQYFCKTMTCGSKLCRYTRRRTYLCVEETQRQRKGDTETRRDRERETERDRERQRDRESAWVYMSE
jgi:hypothetical protein